jgi:hypothetical protein
MDLTGSFGHIVDTWLVPAPWRQHLDELSGAKPE